MPININAKICKCQSVCKKRYGFYDIRVASQAKRTFEPVFAKIKYKRGQKRGPLDMNVL